MQHITKMGSRYIPVECARLLLFFSSFYCRHAVVCDIFITFGFMKLVKWRRFKKRRTKGKLPLFLLGMNVKIWFDIMARHAPKRQMGGKWVSCGQSCCHVALAFVILFMNSSMQWGWCCPVSHNTKGGNTDRQRGRDRERGRKQQAN